MTTQATILVETAAPDAPYPDAPPRDDMQNLFYLHERSAIEALKDHFGNPDSTLVWTEARLGPSLSQPDDTRVPDLMVAFNCDVARARRDNGYSLANQPHPPEFVLEVASRTTGIVDYTEKRADYARYGVAEYWRFDPTGGAYHDHALAADILVDGRYRRIPIAWTDATHGRAYSAALGLYVCWDAGELRFYDPMTGTYLRTLAEERAERQAETAGRRMAEARAEGASARADAEAEARQREAQARQQAEAQAADEAARADAEAEARQREAQARQREAEARRRAEARAETAEARLAELERERRDRDE